MKQISQDYFNETVKSNMELFDLSLDDAIKETIESFTLEEVDLSNIIKDMLKHAEGHPGVSCLNSLKNLRCTLPTSVNDVIEELKTLKSISASEYAVRKFLATSGAVEDILLLLDVLYIQRLFKAFALSAKTLKTIMKGQSDILSESDLKRLIDLLSKIMEEFCCNSADTEEFELISSLYSVLRASCTNNEPNRLILSQPKVIMQSMSLLLMASDNNENDRYNKFVPMVREICRFIQALTQDDDMRVTYGQGANNSRTIAESDLALETFVNLIKGALKWSISNLLPELLVTLSAIITREEICTKFASLGGIDMILQIMYANMNKREIVSASLVLLKTLCGSDPCKRTIGSWCYQADCSGDKETEQKISGPSLIMDALEQYISNPVLVKHSAAVIAALVLRQPDLAEPIVSAGAPESLAKAFELHSQNAATVRAICMAIRNCVSRRPELCTMFVGSSSINSNTKSTSDMDPYGLECLLNSALKNPDCYDEAKAALRDLGCHVELKELWRGTQSGIKY